LGVWFVWFACGVEVVREKTQNVIIIGQTKVWRVRRV
jgi:hypothetical protein